MSGSSPESESDSPATGRKSMNARLPLSECDSGDDIENEPTPLSKKAPAKKVKKTLPAAGTRLSTRPASSRQPSTKQAQTGGFSLPCSA